MNEPYPAGLRLVGKLDPNVDRAVTSEPAQAR